MCNIFNITNVFVAKLLASYSSYSTDKYGLGPGSAYFHVLTNDLYVFSDGSIPCRTAALIAVTPYVYQLTQISRHPAFVHLSTFSHKATIILQWLSSRVLGVTKACLTRNSKELKQSKASIRYRLICKHNVYKLSIYWNMFCSKPYNVSHLENQHSNLLKQ